MPSLPIVKMKFQPGLKGQQGNPGPTAWSLPVAYASGITAVVGPPATTVLYQGEVYACTVAHTTTSTFAPANWTKISAKGDAGPQGAQRIQGATGATGPQGPIGATGPQ